MQHLGNNIIPYEYFSSAQTILSNSLRLGNILFYNISELFAKKIQISFRDARDVITKSCGYLRLWGGDRPRKNKFSWFHSALIFTGMDCPFWFLEPPKICKLKFTALSRFIIHPMCVRALVTVRATRSRVQSTTKHLWGHHSLTTRSDLHFWIPLRAVQS